ncbi:T-lymphoma invasion and metastasis-inducing protein 2 [Camelus dromedarius]|uniref:T-lymphoma invasion and metastasis-inducing protein 2 n=1 Tax=Camelus dromedarius TaxID=9838 RepID=A0A5N4DVR6_CAMDR|nr:T-lymphoma invasion and metastasis-inducing protein 2 [Camelus dromedarius]
MVEASGRRRVRDFASPAPGRGSAEEIAVLCGFNDTQTNGMDGPRESQDPPPRPLARHLSDADRLRKVIQELVDTEKSYVKMESLFGSLPEMLEFQKVFLETLEDGISASSDFNILETPSQFRKLLFSLGGSFLYYADHFKLYSGFCANHIKVQKVLERAWGQTASALIHRDFQYRASQSAQPGKRIQRFDDSCDLLRVRGPGEQVLRATVEDMERFIQTLMVCGHLNAVEFTASCRALLRVFFHLLAAKTDKAFKAFLDARNPTKQHSSTLESYLIKPVQRVLKYPLLLRELVSLTDHDSEEHYHLTEALKAMEKVASHINEMQKIYEDYGTVFDQLVAEQSGTEKEVTELSMGELLMHSTVSWLNPFLSLGKARKDLELTVFVFKRAVILVYKENCKLKKKLPSNSRPAHSSADLDPFKFRWLIPISALQVRLGNTAGTESNSLWELIHTRSEVEGRPETSFQLCCRYHCLPRIKANGRDVEGRQDETVGTTNVLSLPTSDNESKTNIVKVIRSILRENFRRHIKCEFPLEKTCKDRLVPLKNRVPVSAKLASSRSLRGLKNSSSSEWPGEPGRGSSLDSDEGSLSSSTPSSGCPAAGSQPEPGKGPQASLAAFPDGLIKESDILSDDDEDHHQPRGRGSPTKDIEIQFQRLRISEDPDAPLADGPPSRDGQPGGPQSKLVRGHFCAIKRKANSTKRDRGTLLKAQTRHQSLDSRSENANLDLNAVLEREFSVQSLTSVVNEECFYETESHGKS